MDGSTPSADQESGEKVVHPRLKRVHTGEQTAEQLNTGESGKYDSEREAKQLEDKEFRPKTVIGICGIFNEDGGVGKPLIPFPVFFQFG